MGLRTLFAAVGIVMALVIAVPVQADVTPSICPERYTLDVNGNDAAIPYCTNYDLS